MERCLSCMNDGLMSTLSIEVTAWQELGYPEAVVVQTIKTACEQYSGKRALKVSRNVLLVGFRFSCTCALRCIGK
jgi:hypothetical protein